MAEGDTYHRCWQTPQYLSYSSTAKKIFITVQPAHYVHGFVLTGVSVDHVSERHCNRLYSSTENLLDIGYSDSFLVQKRTFIHTYTENHQ